MKHTLVALWLIATAGCALPRARPVAIEQIGPVRAEVYRIPHTDRCERRVYLDSLYYRTDVPCPKAPHGR